MIFPASSQSRSFHETAANNRSRKFPGKAVVKSFKRFDRYKFKSGDPEGTA